MLTPVQEVALFLHKEAVNERIEKRKAAVLKSVTITYTTPAKTVTAKKKKTPDVDYIVIESSEEEDEGSAEVAAASSAAAATTATTTSSVKSEPPSHEKLAVPKTIRDEWRRIERLWHDGETDAPQCPCSRCPYSSGGPLANRFRLLERLVELEHYLWGQ